MKPFRFAVCAKRSEMSIERVLPHESFTGTKNEQYFPGNTQGGKASPFLLADGRYQSISVSIPGAWNFCIRFCFFVGASVFLRNFSSIGMPGCCLFGGRLFKRKSSKYHLPRFCFWTGRSGCFTLDDFKVWQLLSRSFCIFAAVCRCVIECVVGFIVYRQMNRNTAAAHYFLSEK